MKSAREFALSSKKRKDEEDRIREENYKREQKALMNLRDELAGAVNEALEDMAKIPNVRRKGDTLTVNGHKFEVKVEQVSGTMRYWDEGPEEAYTSYVIRWYSLNGACFGGCSDVDSFNRQFGQHMAMFL